MKIEKNEDIGYSALYFIYDNDNRYIGSIFPNYNNMISVLVSDMEDRKFNSEFEAIVYVNQL